MMHVEKQKQKKRQKETCHWNEAVEKHEKNKKDSADANK